MPHPIMIACLRLKYLNSFPTAWVSLSWIASCTNRCPRCKSPIEKNGGCNHMTCKYCSNEFCWLCQCTWKNHNSGGLVCQDWAKLEEEKKNRLKAKALENANFLENFPKIYDKYLEKVQQIEKNRKSVLEKLESLVLNKFGPKMKKKAENFANFIFGNRKNL